MTVIGRYDCCAPKTIMMRCNPVSFWAFSPPKLAIPEKFAPSRLTTVSNALIEPIKTARRSYHATLLENHSGNTTVCCGDGRVSKRPEPSSRGRHMGHRQRD